MQLLKLRLIVESILRAGSAVHEELDDSPHLGWVMQPAVPYRPGLVWAFFRSSQEMSEGQTAEASADRPEHLSAVQALPIVGCGGSWLIDVMEFVGVEQQRQVLASPVCGGTL